MLSWVDTLCVITICGWGDIEGVRGDADEDLSEYIDRLNCDGSNNITNFKFK